MTKPMSWWDSLSNEMKWIATLVAGAAALGTLIVVSNRYIILPQRVDAAEASINDLKGWAKEIQGYTKALQESNRSSTLKRDMEHPLEEQDAHGIWWCCNTTTEDCWSRNTWRRCETP